MADGSPQSGRLENGDGQGLALTHDTPYGGVAHHQVDVHVFDSASGDYRGRLRIFGQCPKAGKRQCRVRGCGAQPFLQQFERRHFKPALFFGAPKVILFDRAAGFLVSLPKIDGKLRQLKWRDRNAAILPLRTTIFRFERSTARVQRDVANFFTARSRPDREVFGSPSFICSGVFDREFGTIWGVSS